MGPTINDQFTVKMDCYQLKMCLTDKLYCLFPSSRHMAKWWQVNQKVGAAVQIGLYSSILLRTSAVERKTHHTRRAKFRWHNWMAWHYVSGQCNTNALAIYTWTGSQCRFGLAWFDSCILRPCRHDTGYRPVQTVGYIIVHIDGQTQVHSAQSSLVVTHPSTNRGRRA